MKSKEKKNNKQNLRNSQTSDNYISDRTDNNEKNIGNEGRLSEIAFEVAKENNDIPKITELPSDEENLKKYGVPNPPVPNRAHTEM